MHHDQNRGSKKLKLSKKRKLNENRGKVIFLWKYGEHVMSIIDL